MEDDDATDGAAELVGVDCEEVACDDAADGLPVRIWSVLLITS